MYVAGVNAWRLVGQLPQDTGHHEFLGSLGSFGEGLEGGSTPDRLFNSFYKCLVMLDKCQI